MRSLPEFRAKIVDLCQREDRSVGQVASHFELTETAVREWVKHADRNAGTPDDGGLASDEHRELADPRCENPAEGGREILKWTAAFFALIPQ